MAGFFSLGGASASTNPHHQQNLYSPPNSNLFHQVIQQDNNNSQFPASVPGFGVGPTTKLSDDHQQSLPLAMVMMRSAPSGVQGGNCSSDGRRGSISCQDCGNHAKKECVHMRCRTCCKSRGFECQTHVESTWVPAAKRRERQQQHQLQLKRLCHADHQPNSTTAAAAASNSSLGCSTSSTRLAPSPSALGGGTLETGTSRLPPEVRFAAVFKCIRVSPIDQGEDGQLEQLAYQTSVNIGGHVFKGILYDQGPEEYHHQQSHYNSNLGQHDVHQHLISNTQHGSCSFDPRMTNAYQNAKPNPISFPGASGGTHFFP